MTLFIVFSAIVLAAAALWFGNRYRHARRLRELATHALDPRLLSLLRAHMPLYDRLPLDLQQRLQGLVNVFLNDKNFFGSAGLEITDEMRLAVAGNACVLLLSRDDPRFPGSRTIILYPDTFVAHQATMDGNVVHEGPSARHGESWRRGPVILSWADVLRGINNPDDGHNVVIHEFAHKLDEENGPVDGLPVLQQPADYAEWARVMTKEFAGLYQRVQRNRNRALDAYGSTSPPEFFAVASETFFERGKRLQSRLPQLYKLLQSYYGVDTANWIDRGDNP